MLHKFSIPCIAEERTLLLLSCREVQKWSSVTISGLKVRKPRLSALTVFKSVYAVLWVMNNFPLFVDNLFPLHKRNLAILFLFYIDFNNIYAT